MACLTLLLISAPAASPRQTDGKPAEDNPSPSPFFLKVIANQEESEQQLDVYERIQRQRPLPASGEGPAPGDKAWRLFPMGTGIDKIPVTPEGKPLSLETYRNDLEKLEKYLLWVALDGPSQREAYAKADRKKKERMDLLHATYQAFIFTKDGVEKRGDRTLIRYNITPNPSYRPTTRNTTLFKRVQGTVWVDEQSSQMAKIDGVVTEDISLALFLAKVYKGSHFMQERYEVAPGLWEPTFEQYDFDGRKFLYSFSIHERTFYSNYRRVGPPKEAVEVVRAELGKLRSEGAAQ